MKNVNGQGNFFQVIFRLIFLTLKVNHISINFGFCWITTYHLLFCVSIFVPFLDFLGLFTISAISVPQGLTVWSPLSPPASTTCSSSGTLTTPRPTARLSSTSATRARTTTGSSRTSTSGTWLWPARRTTLSPLSQMSSGQPVSTVVITGLPPIVKNSHLSDVQCANPSNLTTAEIVLTSVVTGDVSFTGYVR